MAALPDELIDTGLAVGPAGPRARAAARSTATPGVGTLGVTPLAFDEGRAASSSCGSSRSLPPPERGPLRLLLGAFGDPGHAFPMIALGAALARARPRRDAADVDALGASTSSARGHALRRRAGVPRLPHARAAAQALRGGRARGARRRARWSAALRPDAVVADILTLAPALAGELEGVPVATLIPHVDPRTARRAARRTRSGARLPRTARRARALWRALDRGSSTRGLEHGPRRAQRDARAARPAAARPRARRDLARSCALVATFPQLEYPRALAGPATHVVGPLLWEPPAGDVEPPPGRRPARARRAVDRRRTPTHRLLRAALERARRRARARARDVEPPAAGRAARRAAATRGSSTGSPTRATMPRCDVVVCHGGHGTLARALAERLRGRRRPGRRRHERERRARRLGRASACACRGACARRARCGLAVERALADAALRAARPRARARGRAATTRRRGRPSSSRQLAA